MNRLCIYIHLLFFRLFSQIGYYRVPSRSLLVICFICSNVYMSVPISQFIPPRLPLGNHKFVFCICDSPLLSSFQTVILCFHLVLELVTFFFFKEPNSIKWSFLICQHLWFHENLVLWVQFYLNYLWKMKFTEVS